MQALFLPEWVTGTPSNIGGCLRSPSGPRSSCPPFSKVSLHSPDSAGPYLWDYDRYTVPVNDKRRAPPMPEPIQRGVAGRYPYSILLKHFPGRSFFVSISILIKTRTSFS